MQFYCAFFREIEFLNLGFKVFKSRFRRKRKTFEKSLYKLKKGLDIFLFLEFFSYRMEKISIFFVKIFILLNLWNDFICEISELCLSFCGNFFFRSWPIWSYLIFKISKFLLSIFCNFPNLLALFEIILENYFFQLLPW